MASVVAAKLLDSSDTPAKRSDSMTCISHGRWLPLLAIMFAALCFSWMALCVRHLSLLHIPSFQITFFRSLVQCVACIGIFLKIGRPVTTWLGEDCTEAFWLSCRALTGFVSISFNVIGFGLLPLAESQILGQMQPVFTPIVALLALGERWYAVEMASAAVSLVGVTLIARPSILFGEQAALKGTVGSSPEAHTLGVCANLLGGLFVSCSTVLVRFLGTRLKVHWSLVMFYQSLGGTIMSLICLLLTEDPVMPTLWSGSILALTGLLGTCGQVASTFGVQREKAATGSLVQKGLSPILGFVNQLIFFPADPIFASTIAGFFVTSCSVGMAGFGKAWQISKEVKKTGGYVKLEANPRGAEKLPGA